MFGASYTFGNFAIVSVDYERDWYNGIRMKDVPRYNDLLTEDYKAEFKHDFQATNSCVWVPRSVRCRSLALRVGGGFTDSMLKERDTYTYGVNTGMPVTYKSCYVSAGLGVSLSRSVTLDIAYQNVSTS